MERHSEVDQDEFGSTYTVLKANETLRLDDHHCTTRCPRSHGAVSPLLDAVDAYGLLPFPVHRENLERQFAALLDHSQAQYTATDDPELWKALNDYARMPLNSQRLVVVRLLVARTDSNWGAPSERSRADTPPAQA